MSTTSPTGAQSMVSLLLQGNTKKAVIESGESGKGTPPKSATATFQVFLESKKYDSHAKVGSALVAGSTWFVRQTLTPAMAVVELGVRILQFVLVAIFNVFSGSLFAKRIPEGGADYATKYQRFAANVRETNAQLGYAAVSAFFAIFTPLAKTVCASSAVGSTSYSSSCPANRHRVATGRVPLSAEDSEAPAEDGETPAAPGELRSLSS